MTVTGGTGTKLLEKVLSMKNVHSYDSNHEPKVYKNRTPPKWLKLNVSKCVLEHQRGLTQ